ncbi:hypothetical protein SEA_NICEHOUSE_106 [Rhodococcus phage NiceHouse]|nr:hypothetical protein SEA_NICEHOUSE_106 [Rhodococcus phage NiceHouse]
MQAYVELLEAVQEFYKPEVDLIQSMRTEVQFRVNMGAELAEALAEHYEHTRKQYGLQPSSTPVEPEGQPGRLEL